jgi:large subunit ribosomal protein L24
VKTGDIVEVITGKYKGTRGIIQKVFLKEGKALVDGVNVVTRHRKSKNGEPTKDSKSMPIHVSNIALIDPSLDRVGRVSYKIEDNKKVRYFKKTGTILEHPLPSRYIKNQNNREMVDNDQLR